MVIILISSNGYGQGKSTFADYLKDKLEKVGFVVYRTSFAKKLKEVAKFMGWNGQKDEKGRKLLQLLGTEVGRSYDPELWVKWVDIDIHKQEVFEDPPDVVIIDDWRFKNEAHYFIKLGYYVITVRINGEKDKRDEHSSEHDLDDFRNYDIEFTNKFISPLDDFTIPAEKIVSLVTAEWNSEVH